MLVRTNRFIGGAGFLLAATLVVASANPLGAQTIDQQQTGLAALFVGNTGTAANNGGWYAQSFIPDSLTSAGAALYLANRSSPGSLTVELWNNSPGATGAQELASGTAAVTGPADGYSSVFWNPVSVMPGSQYFLAFYSATTYGIGANYGGANGQYVNYNNSDTNTHPYSGNRCCTTAYMEYAHGAAAGPPTSSVPEPSSVALLGTGLLGLIPMVRRRVARGR